MTRAVRRNVWDVPQFNLDGVQAVVDESAKFGRKVAAHARGDKGIAPAVDGGVNSPEHATGIGEATLEKMQRRGMQKAEYAAQPRNTGMHRAIAASVTIAYGTDAGAAEPIGASDRGRPAPGKLADVVIFSGNPVEQIGLMERPPAPVVLGGQRVDTTHLP